MQAGTAVKHRVLCAAHTPPVYEYVPKSVPVPVPVPVRHQTGIGHFGKFGTSTRYLHIPLKFWSFSILTFFSGDNPTGTLWNST